MSLKVGELFASMELDMSGFKQSLKAAQSKMKATGDKMKQVGKEMTTKVTAPIAGIGAASVMTVAKFDDSMSKVSAITGSTGQDLDKLRDQAKNLGATTRFSASEAAEGMTYLGMAGWDTTQILSAMPSMLNLASAGAVELGTAADITSDIMSAFSIKAEDAGNVADVLAKTASSSNTSIEMLGESMKYAGAAAASAGMDIQETNAILGILANSGIKGSQAGTTLTAMLRDVKKAAKDGAIAIGETSVSVYDAQGNMKGMTEILAGIEQATNGMTGAQKDAAMSAVFQEQALKGVQIAMQTGTGAIKNLEKELYNADGASKQMAETMESNIGGAFRSLKSALEGLMIQIGEVLTPILMAFIENILKPLINWFGGLSKGMQTVIVIVAGVVAAIGPLILILGSVISTVTTLSATLSTFGISLAAIATPVGIAIAAITALIAIGVALYENWDEIKAAAKEIWQAVVRETKNAYNAIGGMLNKIGEWFSSLGKKAFEWGKNMIDGFIDGIKAMASKVVSAVKGVIGKAKSYIGFNSPAEKGEGRNIVDWGANMIDGFLEGVNSMKPTLDKTMSDVMSGIEPSASMAGGQSISVGNIYIQSNATTGRGMAQDFRRELALELRRQVKA